MTNAQLNRFKDKAFQAFGLFCTFFGLIVLAIFLLDILKEGLARLDWDFLTSLPSRRAARAGILTAWAGTLWILVMTALIAIPLGVAAGIYLEEYGKKTRMASFLEINIANLAGVPSIIYGLLGLELFVRQLQLGGSLLAGALTLSLLVLPIIIVTTREAIKAVPKSLREASFALGASKWQTIRMQVLPAATGGIMTGIILSLSRAVGEAAPLIVIGALAYVPFVPEGPMDEFTVLPIQIFNWVSRPQEAFLINAAAAIIVLLCITFMLNGIAVYLRYRQQKKVKW
ncbi:phosphate ABC transporter permease PstA [Nafulsella turpanensis]|uniref:phosphate ABC transporter permease PstA n=1 Tax=Nafulsella turpanensis TaxID=1265690 RepID=UPI00034B19A7|nr:phosphate ABC transporter permease PstA [Nafulsella turpanensis]